MRYKNWTIEKKDEIEKRFINIITKIGMDIPLNFEDINESNRMRQKVTLYHWTQLQNICNIHGMLPPAFGSNNNIIIGNLKQTKTWKKNSQ